MKGAEQPFEATLTGGSMNDLAARTINDFGRQWSIYSDSSGFFGSPALLADFVQPFDIADFAGARVADIGAGTGRFCLALLAAGAREVIAIEPSAAAQVARKKLGDVAPDRATVLQIPGDKTPPSADFDYIISIGVLHHIPEPAAVVRAAYAALKPGGKFIVWLYGKEGNRLYLVLLGPLRAIAKLLPHPALAALAWSLSVPASLYAALCRAFPRAPMPLSDYFGTIFARLPKDKRQLVIYDQLNPQYAKYYTRAETAALMAAAPFAIALHHRRDYSWLAIGTKQT
jgi:SAM-dependent methyltransferase